MSKPKITSTIDYLSDPKKAITTAVLLLLAIATISFVWKKISGIWKNSSLQGGVEDANIQSSTNSSITPTLNFPQLANRMWDATDRFGTTEEEVFAVLACLQTQADYVKLCRAWRDLYEEKGWWFRLQAMSTLPGTLTSELDASELSRARAILTDKGITPDF